MLNAVTIFITALAFLGCFVIIFCVWCTLICYFHFVDWIMSLEGWWKGRKSGL